MKLVFIYGPPGVGKLTVAMQLAKITGFKVYHNHVSIEFVKSLFDFGTPTFWRLVDKYRKEMLEEVAKENVNTIFTFVYGKGIDDEFTRDIIGRVESHGGRVCFVRLYCEPEILLNRVGRKSRRKFSKLTSKSHLSHLFKKFDISSEIPFVKSLNVDTGGISALKAARRIARYYKLGKKKE